MVHGSKKDAEAKLRQVLTALDKGDYITPSQEAVGEFLDKWLETYAATNTSPRTLKDYRGLVARYLVPALGGIQFRMLRPGHVQGLYADMRERGLSAQTILHVHRLLREALSHAVKWGIVTRNVCDSVDSPRPTRREMSTLSKESVSSFLAACDSSPHRGVLYTLLYTGRRRSEALALKWENVDLDKGTLAIVAGLHRLPGKGLVLLPVKTAKSRRQIDITHEVVDLLREIRGSQLVSQVELGTAWQESGFVFTKPDGRCADPEDVTRAFKAIMRSIGTPDVRLHDLRHTHASLMLAANVHPKVVSERLGHASVTITMDIYSHVLPGIQRDAADKFSRLLSGRAIGTDE